MEQFRQIGEVWGSVKALMVLKEDIQINQRQCCLLLDTFKLAYKTIAEEIKNNLRLEEKNTKWKALEQPLKELHRIFKEGELYIRNCLDFKDWWGKAISLHQNKDCVEFHIHNLLSCFHIVIEAIETAEEISGLDQDEMQKRHFMLERKYVKEWNDPKLFLWKLGKQYLVGRGMRSRLETAWREDRWLLLEAIAEKKTSSDSLGKYERRLGDLVMELLNKDLGSLIKEQYSPKRRIPFSLPAVIDLMLQIARGMEYLFIWHAPEVLAEQDLTAKYSEKADVYSYGMLCFELLTGKVPFEDGHLQGEKMGRNIIAGERPLFPVPSPKFLANLTRKCWQSDPLQRPSFSSICRILRYMKKFIVMNPGHNQLLLPSPPVDYCDIETGFINKFSTEAKSELSLVSQIPFQMFAYRLLEKEKICLGVKDKRWDSSSELASICGDPIIRAASICGDSNIREASVYGDPINRAASISGDPINRESSVCWDDKAREEDVSFVPKASLLNPSRSLRMTPRKQVPPLVMTPIRRTRSSHISGSALS